MGRTIPSFRIALNQEKKQWRSFRNALETNDRHVFDHLFFVSKLHISACVIAAKPVRIHSILMSILLYQYKILISLRER